MRGANTVKCQTFALGMEALPSADIIGQTLDPTRLAEAYAKAGFTKLAENVGPMHRMATAQQNYEELSPDDYTLAVNYFSRILRPEDCTADNVAPPTEGALAASIAAQDSNIFDEVSALTHPTTKEVLLVGTVGVPGTSLAKFFKIVHWGYELTSFEALRQQATAKHEQARKAAKGPSLTERLGHSIGTSIGRSLRIKAVRYGLLMAGTAAACWGLLYLTDWWWVFAPVLVVAVGGVNYHVYQKTFYGSPVRYLVTWMMIANLVGGAAVGILKAHGFYTTDHYRTVAVCDITAPEKKYAVEDEDSGFAHRWVLMTSEGEFRLDTGQYDGAYYGTNERVGVFAQNAKGKELRVTWHWGGFGDKYVSHAETTGTASCG